MEAPLPKSEIESLHDLAVPWGSYVGGVNAAGAGVIGMPAFPATAFTRARLDHMPPSVPQSTCQEKHIVRPRVV